MLCGCQQQHFSYPRQQLTTETETLLFLHHWVGVHFWGETCCGRFGLYRGLWDGFMPAVAATRAVVTAGKSSCK